MSFNEWISRARMINRVRHTDYEVEMWLEELSQMRAGKRTFKITEEQHKILNNGRKKWNEIVNNEIYRNIR